MNDREQELFQRIVNIAFKKNVPISSLPLPLTFVFIVASISGQKRHGNISFIVIVFRRFEGFDIVKNTSDLSRKRQSKKAYIFS